MLKPRKLFFTIVALMVMVFAFTSTCYGNSAEPPSILIIVSNAPDDLEISIGSEKAIAKAHMSDKVLEKYYTFYSRDLRAANDYIVKVNTGESTFEVVLKEPINTYNNIFTLDLTSQTLTPGKSLSRSILLVSLRIALTLLIEAFVFWLFGFRDKLSWAAFITINLITQGALNIWLNGFAPLGSYIFLTLAFGEILVFIAEIFAFLTFIEEHRRLRTFLYVMIANLLSLFAGGYIITVLPI